MQTVPHVENVLPSLLMLNNVLRLSTKEIFHVIY